MPRYFFHLENGHRISADEGDDFPDDASALAAAQEVAKDFAKNRSGNKLRIIVTNEAGAVVTEVPLIQTAL
jgi:hypothetical protein